MKTLIDDTSTAAPAGGTSLDSLLSEYKAPLNVNPAPGVSGTPGSPSQPMNPDFSKPLVNTINQGQQFYKTGKKAGQPKPNRAPNYGPPPQQPGYLPGGPTQPGQPIQNQLISGAMFITLIDLVFPFLIAFINNKFSKVKIDGDKLKLTEAQRKDFEPLCNEAVRQLNIQANPVVLLGISLAGAYGLAYMGAKAEAEQKTKK